METTVKIVGIGPGDGRYLTPLAAELIKQAQVLVGGRRQLEQLAAPHQERFTISANLAAVLQYIEAQRRQKSVVVMASGDPGLFSIATYLAERMDKDCLEIIPGISSVQVMFARLKLPWHDVRIMSLHGRSGDELDNWFQLPGTICLLTGGEWTPRHIARHLRQAGRPDWQVAIGAHLSYPEEQIILTSLTELAEESRDYTNCLMVIFHE